MAPHEAPSRVVNEIADMLEAGMPLPVSLLLRLQGVLTTCAHYAVTFSQRLGRGCFLPGFLYDPRYVRQGRIQANQRLFPHPLNAVDIV